MIDRHVLTARRRSRAPSNPPCACGRLTASTRLDPWPLPPPRLSAPPDLPPNPRRAASPRPRSYSPPLAAAKAYQKQSLAIYVATNGDDSRDTAAVRESLAITYTQSGRFAEAASLMQPVAAWRERNLGPDHPNTLVARYNMAYVRQGLG